MTVPTRRVLGDRYLLQQLLASGGMGEVWQGEDTLLERPVAVKVPRSGLAHDPDFLARFHTEARHAALLTHPNIASVFDFGDDEEGPYLVMELVGGQPLSAIIRRSAPLNPDWVEGVVRQVAGALACAHAAGVVHRDVKPANLLVCPDGTVKVTDFGIARAVGAAATTQVGMVTGTAPYLAPEQLAGELAAPASDLYALGVVAYECLAGRRPFDGDPAAIWWAHRDERPPPPLPTAVPRQLRALVAAPSSRDPADRPTAASLAGTQPVTGAAPGAPQPDPYPATEPTVVAPSPTTVSPLDALIVQRKALAPRRSRGGARVHHPALDWLPDGLARWALLPVALILLAVGVMATGHSAGPAATRAQGPGAPPPVAVRVAAVTLFHPGGSGDDHPADAPLAADGNPATAWRTQHYATATFGNLRPGVGLVFDLGVATRLRGLELTLTDPGAALEVHAGNDPARLLSAPAVGRTSSAGGLFIQQLGGTTARYWLVWITRLPEGNGHQAGIAEARFLRA